MRTSFKAIPPVLLAILLVEHVAFPICRSNLVALYQDVPTGLRASYYVQKKGAAMPSTSAPGPFATAP